MQICIDKFIPVKGKFGEIKHINRAFNPVGKPLKVLYEQKTARRLVMMSTGIIYQRPETYVETSPYGYNNLHKMFILDSRVRKSFNVFDIAMNYEIALHLTHMVRISKTSYKTDELKQRDTQKTIDNFYNIQIKLYEQFNLKKDIVEIFQYFNVYGVDADNFV